MTHPEAAWAHDDWCQSVGHGDCCGGECDCSRLEFLRVMAAVRADERERALHEAATQTEAYLQENHSPPIWWHISDILHTLAGCTWDDDAGEDGCGEYNCEAAVRGLVEVPERIE